MACGALADRGGLASLPSFGRALTLLTVVTASLWGRRARRRLLHVRRRLILGLRVRRRLILRLPVRLRSAWGFGAAPGRLRIRLRRTRALIAATRVLRGWLRNTRSTLISSAPTITGMVTESRALRQRRPVGPV